MAQPILLSKRRSGELLLRGLPPVFSPLVRRIAVVLAALLLYVNTIPHDRALDDNIVITSNAFVQRGVAGIPDILTHDTFRGFLSTLGAESELTGGRYRPLSLVTFAIEQSLTGGSPHVAHAVNVLLYAVTGLLLLVLLERHFLTGRPWAAFLAALLFVVHPVHTEVVANIKSRDEILALLFALAALKLHMDRIAEPKAPGATARLAGTVVCFFLALLSKESALTFLAVVPLALYTFRKMRAAKAVLATLPFAATTLVYLTLRLGIVGVGRPTSSEILNAPFLHATGAQKLATIASVQLDYLRLLVWPNPLAADYAFAQIPYSSFGDLRVWLSLGIHGALLAVAAALLPRRSVLAFAILYYFATVAIVSNLLVDIGAMMGERFLYMPSLGFALAAGLGLGLLAEGAAAIRRGIAGSLAAGAVLLASFHTVDRNRAWEDNTSLGLADEVVSCGSASANLRAGLSYFELSTRTGNDEERKALLQRAVEKMRRAVAIHPTYNQAEFSLGAALCRLGDVEAAEEHWNRARERYPSFPGLVEYDQILARWHADEGARAGAAGDLESARAHLEKSVRYGPGVAGSWSMLGGALHGLGRIPAARAAWERAVELDPADEQSRRGLEATK
jgi:tetratricopeptide (TPR) repeat protein